MIASSRDYSKDFLNKLILIEEELLETEESFIFESLSILLMEEEGKTTTSNQNDKSSTLKQYFITFKNAIVSIFKRFMDNVKKLFKVNEKWLQQNKETILNADLSNFTHEIYPYWTTAQYAKRIDEGLPPLSDMVVDQILKKDCNKEVFTTECLKKVGLSGKNIRPGEGFEEDLKTVLRGNYSRKIRGTELSKEIPSIFNYCYDYDDEYKKVQKLQNTIIDACNKGINKVGVTSGFKAISDLNNSKENKQVNESYLLESMILLEEITDNKPKQVLSSNHPKKGAAEIAKEKGSAQNVTELNKRNNEENKDKQDQSTVTKKDGSESIGEMRKMLSAYRVFLEVEQKFLTVRITIMEEKFKVYMSLLRKIVELANGNKQETPKEEKEEKVK